jgi:excisionase family DNA binding protein
MPQVTKQKKRTKTSLTAPDVMTLAEASRFLKLPAKTVEQLATNDDLPGRKIGKEWRFLRSAIEEWLVHRNGHRHSILDQAGMFADDPTFEEFQKLIERNRTRWDEEVA